MTTFGQANDLVGLFVEDVEANDAWLIDIAGVATFEGHHDGLTDAATQHPGQSGIRSMQGWYVLIVIISILAGFTGRVRTCGHVGTEGSEREVDFYAKTTVQSEGWAVVTWRGEKGGGPPHPPGTAENAGSDVMRE